MNQLRLLLLRFRFFFRKALVYILVYVFTITIINFIINAKIDEESVRSLYEFLKLLKLIENNGM